MTYKNIITLTSLGDNYWGQRSTLAVFLRLSQPYFLRYWVWSSLIWIGWLDQWVPRVWLFLSLLPLTTLLGLQVCTIAPGFYVTTTDLNSGPSAWTPSTLPTELSPWAPRSAVLSHAAKQYSFLPGSGHYSLTQTPPHLSPLVLTTE